MFVYWSFVFSDSVRRRCRWWWPFALTPNLRPLIDELKVESATPVTVGQWPPSRPAVIASLSPIILCSFQEYIGRSSLVQRAVLPFVIIVVKISIESLLQCMAICVTLGIDLIELHGSPQTLNEYVVQRPSSTIHTDCYVPIQ